MINIVIVDDHQIVRDGLKILLESDENIKVLAEGADGVDVVHLIREYHPDILLIDIRMPKLSGLEAIKMIKKNHFDTKIIVLSMYDGEQYIVDALKHGADGYLLKDTSKKELLKAIYHVYRGEKHFGANITSILLKYMMRTNIKNFTQEEIGIHPSSIVSSTMIQKTPTLTKREKQIMNFLYEGKNNKKIAEELGKSVRTIETHRFNIMKKMGVNSIVELIKKIDEQRDNI